MYTVDCVQWNLAYQNLKYLLLELCDLETLDILFNAQTV